MIVHNDRSAPEILGSPDDLKFRSCETLFWQAASEDSDRMLFTAALDQFYDGNPDPRTLELRRLDFQADEDWHAGCAQPKAIGQSR
jgi:uncharacterized protein (DUF1810 family)